jgi:hypothetical protein
MPTDFSTGFQTSSAEQTIFLVVLGLIVLGLIGYQIFQSRNAGKTRRKKKGSATDEQTPVLKRRSAPRREPGTLSRVEGRTLDHLAWFLKDPSRRDRLIDDDRLLVRVARQGIREGIVTEVEVLRLLRKLDIDHEALSAGGQSSDSIPAGAEVSISDRNLNVSIGTLLLSGPSGLRVRIEKGHRSLQTGTTVEVVCGGQEGLYRFHSVVLDRAGKEVALRHSNHIEKVQRRKYRRRALQVPAEVRMPGIDERTISTTTEDLSIGGAAIRNPRKRIITGSQVELTIVAGGTAPLTLTGLVVRASQRGKTCHVSFGSMKEEQRHRLFRTLIRLGGGQR